MAFCSVGGVSFLNGACHACPELEPVAATTERISWSAQPQSERRATESAQVGAHDIHAKDRFAILAKTRIKAKVAAWRASNAIR